MTSQIQVMCGILAVMVVLPGLAISVGECERTNDCSPGQTCIPTLRQANGNFFICKYEENSLSANRNITVDETTVGVYATGSTVADFVARFVLPGSEISSNVDMLPVGTQSGQALILPQAWLGCDSPGNENKFDGRVAVVYRGGCSIAAKRAAAATSGAAALVVIDYAPSCNAASKINAVVECQDKYPFSNSENPVVSDAGMCWKTQTGCSAVGVGCDCDQWCMLPALATSGNPEAAVMLDYCGVSNVCGATEGITLEDWKDYYEDNDHSNLNSTAGSTIPLLSLSRTHGAALVAVLNATASFAQSGGVGTGTSSGQQFTLTPAGLIASSTWLAQLREAPECVPCSGYPWQQRVGAAAVAPICCNVGEAMVAERSSDPLDPRPVCEACPGGMYQKKGLDLMVPNPVFDYRGNVASMWPTCIPFAVLACEAGYFLHVYPDTPAYRENECRKLPPPKPPSCMVDSVRSQQRGEPYSHAPAVVSCPDVSNHFTHLVDPTAGVASDCPNSWDTEDGGDVDACFSLAASTVEGSLQACLNFCNTTSLCDTVNFKHEDGAGFRCCLRKNCRMAEATNLTPPPSPLSGIGPYKLVTRWGGWHVYIKKITSPLFVPYQKPGCTESPTARTLCLDVQAAGRCKDGKSLPSQSDRPEVTQYIQDSCCVCGASNATVAKISVQQQSSSGSNPTPSEPTCRDLTQNVTTIDHLTKERGWSMRSWSNEFGPCNAYSVVKYTANEAYTMCAKGLVTRGMEWSLVSRFNDPDHYCCICGGGDRTPTTITTATSSTITTTTTVYNPNNVDCVEEQSKCTAKCEFASERSYYVITEQKAKGKQCSGEASFKTNCTVGEDECVGLSVCPVQCDLSSSAHLDRKIALLYSYCQAIFGDEVQFYCPGKCNTDEGANGFFISDRYCKAVVCRPDRYDASYDIVAVRSKPSGCIECDGIGGDVSNDCNRAKRPPATPATTVTIPRPTNTPVETRPRPSSPVNLSGFIFLSTSGCPGRNEIGVYTNIPTREACGIACLEEPSCVSFEWGHPDCCPSMRCSLSTSCTEQFISHDGSGAWELWLRGTPSTTTSHNLATRTTDKFEPISTSTSRVSEATKFEPITTSTSRLSEATEQRQESERSSSITTTIYVTTMTATTMTTATMTTTTMTAATTADTAAHINAIGSIVGVSVSALVLILLISTVAIRTIQSTARRQRAQSDNYRNPLFDGNMPPRMATTSPATSPDTLGQPQIGVEIDNGAYQDADDVLAVRVGMRNQSTV